jgi:hypothetical protein
MDKMNPKELNMETQAQTDERIFLSEITPESITPKFESVRTKEYVPFVTEDGQQWPDMIIELYRNSATHGAIIRSIIDQVSGKGLTWDASANNSVLLDSWASNINQHGEDINEVLWKVTTDLVLHNGLSLLVNWSKDWTKIISIEHVDFSKVRANKCDETGKVTHYWYSWDWNNQRSKKTVLPSFNMASAAENKKAYKEALTKGSIEELEQQFVKPTTQLLYYKPYEPGEFYYPLPTYNGALAAIKTDILSDGYGLSAFESGLNASMIVTFFGLLSPDARRNAVKKFNYMHQGPRGKKTVYHFANKSEDSLKIDKIDSNKADGVYTSVNENTLQKILSAHRITDAIIVGVQGSGGWDSGDKVKSAIEYWHNTVINPLQQEVVKVFNKIMAVNQFPELSIDPVELMSESKPLEDVNSEPNNQNIK